MFQVTLTSYGQTQISSQVLIEGIILLYDYIENIASLTSISSYTQILDESACGNLKGTIGNVRLQDFSNSEYQSKTILFYKKDNNEKKILGGYSQETPIIQKTSTGLSLFLSFDFSQFINGFIFSSIQAGYPVASVNNDGLVHIENPNIVSDNSYSVYSKDQVDTLLVSYVPTSRKVNNKSLSSDVTLNLDDVADGTIRKIPTEISELSPNNIGANLVSDHDTSWDLGSNDHRWKILYIESIGTTTNKCSYIYATSIGSSSYPVTTLYATDIYGSLTGKATTSTTAEGLFKTVTDDSSGETVTTTHSVSLDVTDTVKKWVFSNPIKVGSFYLGSYNHRIVTSSDSLHTYIYKVSGSTDKYLDIFQRSYVVSFIFYDFTTTPISSEYPLMLYSDLLATGGTAGNLNPSRVEVGVQKVYLRSNPEISFYETGNVSTGDSSTPVSKVKVESRTETIDSTDVTVYDLNTYIYNRSGNTEATPRYNIYCDSDLVAFFNKNGFVINNTYLGFTYNNDINHYICMTTHTETIDNQNETFQDLTVYLQQYNNATTYNGERFSIKTSRFVNQNTPIAYFDLKGLHINGPYGNHLGIYAAFDDCSPIGTYDKRFSVIYVKDVHADKVGSEYRPITSITAKSFCIPFGECNTESNVADKIVQLGSIASDITTLISGMVILVKFKYSNTASIPRLSIDNGITFKNIYKLGTTSAGVDEPNSWMDGEVVFLRYTGSAWNIIGHNTTALASVGTDITNIIPNETNSYNLGSTYYRWNYLYARYVGSESYPITSIYGRLNSLYGNGVGSIFFFKLIITNNSSTDITVPRGVSLTNTTYFGSNLLSIVSYEEKVDESSSSYGTDTFTGTFYTLIRFTVTANASLTTVYVPCLRYS